MVSLRIKEIGEMIPEGVRLIDVGCDHAYLDIYLANKYPNIECLATDVNANALSSAIKNIKDNNLEDRIYPILTNGLDNIEIKKNDYIVISGMGTNTIIDILKGHLPKINHIIIQSNRDLESLRKFMFQNNFKIKEEKIVFDKKYYIVIHFEIGEFVPQAIDCWLGPLIKNSKNIGYFDYLKKSYEKILQKVPNGSIRESEIISRISYLKEIIEKK